MAMVSSIRAMATPILMSDTPRMPKRKALTMCRIGLASDTVCQNGDSRWME
ncbi:hypothetical protein D3C77_762160 [compost metagenome]